MALAIEVTKKSVSEIQPKLWNITLNLRCLEGAVEVINQDVSIRYRQDEDIDAKQAKLLENMQVIIDKWKSEQNIFDHAKTDTLATYLTNNLVG